MAVALIDGEHYPPVVLDTLARLRPRYRLAGAVSSAARRSCATRSATRIWPRSRLPPCAGRGAAPAPAAARRRAGAALDALLRETGASIVVDLSDEPVLGYRERFHLISVALARGARYVGADFEFSPPLCNDSPPLPRWPSSVPARGSVRPQ